MDPQQASNNNFVQQNSILKQRMPTLDGLRAIAILAVLWHNTTAGHYHGNTIVELINLCSNAGWLGVQLFFVLSGFLITGLLLDGTDEQHRFRNFYARRVLRIFPPYYALLITFCLILPAVFPHTPILHEHLDRSLWNWLFLNNWTSPFIGDTPTLPHLWSLAVEEQFYIVWPACVFFLPRRTLPWLCLCVVLSALIVRFGITLYDPVFASDATYTFTVARWDALAIGSGLAFFMRNADAYRELRRYARPIFYSSAVYIIGFAAIDHNFAPTGQGLIPLNQTIAALFFAALIFMAVQANAGRAHHWQRFLLLPALQSIGKYSYAMYLFHLPLTIILEPHWHRYAVAFSADHPSWSVTTFSFIVFACTYCLAATSWVLLERPCLRLKRFFVNAATVNQTSGVSAIR